MPLQKQALQLTFQKGQDNSDENKLVISSRFTRMENEEWSVKNTIRQRPGYLQQVLTPRSGSPAPLKVKNLLALGREVLLESASGLSSFTELGTQTRNQFDISTNSGGREFERASLVSIDDIKRSDTVVTEADGAAVDGWECSAYVRLSGVGPSQVPHVYAKIINAVSRELLFEQELPTAGSYALLPRVLAYNLNGNSYFRVYWLEPTGSVVLRSVSWATGTGLPPAFGTGFPDVAAVVNTTVGRTGGFDVWYDGSSNQVVVAYSPVGDGVRLRINSGADGFTFVRQSAVLDAGDTTIGPISVTTGISGGIGYALVFYHVAAAPTVTSIRLSTAATIATTTVDSAITVVGRLAAAPSFINGSAVLVWDTNKSTRSDPFSGIPGNNDPFNNEVRIVYCTYAGVLTGAVKAYVKGHQLMARPALYTEGSVQNLAIAVGLCSTVQPTLFVCKEGSAGNAGDSAGCQGAGWNSPQVLARVLPGLVSVSSLSAPNTIGVPGRDMALRLPTAFDNTLSQLQLLFLRKGALTDPQGLARVVLSFSAPLNSTLAQETLLLAGACPQLYDGLRAHEAGFNAYPDDLYYDQSTVGIAASRLTELATYGIIGVYEWRDNHGKLHRSAPSVPRSYALTGTHNVITVSFPFLRLTGKQTVSGLTNSFLPDEVQLVVYHTEGNGTLYYRSKVTSNNVSSNADAQMVLDEKDSDLIKGELLYTTGGGLENEAFPSTGVVAMHQRRVFMAVDGGVQYTDEIDDDRNAPATNEAYFIPTPPAGGRVVGLVSMDEKLIIIARHQIYFVYGSGPNRLGQQNSFSLPEICSSLIGGLSDCVNSVVLTPDGVWFMSSQRGLRLLTRGLVIAPQFDVQPGDNSSFLGVEVDDVFTGAFNDVRAVTVDGREQVRFYIAGSDQGVVVWDYEQHQWSRFTNHLSEGGAVQSRQLFWHSDGTNLYTSRSAAGGFDNLSIVPQVLETAWLALADRQGFQRIYSLMLLAQAVGAGTIAVEEGFDFQDTYTSAVALAPIFGTFVDIFSLSGYVGAGWSGGGTNTVTGGTSGATALAEYPVNPPPFGFVSPFIVSHLTGTFQLAEVLSGAGAIGTITSITPGLLIADADAAQLRVGHVLTGQTSAAFGTVTGVVANVTGTGLSFVGLGASSGTFRKNGETYSVSAPFVYTVAGTANPIQIEHKLSRQKCDAVRFRITITPGSSTEFLRLAAFAVSVGLQTGLNRLPATQRF